MAPRTTNHPHITREDLSRALEKHGGNVLLACEDLRVPRRTVYRRLKQWRAAPTVSASTSPDRACSNCGRGNHNRSTCPNVVRVPSLISPAEQLAQFNAFLSRCA